MDGQFQQFRIVPHENPSDRWHQNLSRHEHEKPPDVLHAEADPKQIVQLPVVSCTVVVTDYRRGSHGVTEHHCQEDILHVHDGSVGGHAVGAGVAHELHVVGHGHDGSGDIGHQLGHAIISRLADWNPFQLGPPEPEESLVGPQEIQQGKESSHQLGNSRGQCSTSYAPAESGDKYRIQHHVGHPGADGDDQTQFRAFRQVHEGLEHVLKLSGDDEGNADSSVEHRILQHGWGSSQQKDDLLHEDDTQNGDDNTDDGGDLNHHGEVLIGLLFFTLPTGHGDQGGSTRAEDGAEAAENHDGRHHQIDGSEGIFAHKIGHKKTVHHPVEGGEQHHEHSRSAEAQDAPGRKVIRQLNGILWN